MTKRAREKITNPEVQDLVEQAEALHEIKALYDQPGGKQLVSLLLKDVVSTVHLLANGNQERDMLCERLKANLNLARLLIKAEENEQHLDDLIADALAE